MIIFAQIAGIAELIFIILSFLKKNKRDFLVMQMLASVFDVLMYFSLNAVSAMFCSIIACLRAVIFFNYEKINKRTPVIFLLFFEFSYIMVGKVSGHDNFISYMPVIASLLFTYGTWQKNIKKTYIISAFLGAFMIYYNFKVGAYIGIIMNLMQFITSLYGMYILTKEDKEELIKTINKDMKTNKQIVTGFKDFAKKSNRKFSKKLADIIGM